MLTCKIEWIDERGEPTPDNNPAIGHAVFTSTTRSGEGGTIETQTFPICAAHAARMPSPEAMRAAHERMHQHLGTVERDRLQWATRWSFEPFALDCEAL